MLSPVIQKILEHYSYETPAIRARLAGLLTHGATGETGKLIISAVDQGFEHGPMQSFEANSEAYDPLYHFRFAYENELSGLAAPVGFLQAGVDAYPGQIPLILKLNSSNKLLDLPSPDQAVTSSVDEAIRLGCVGVGFTIYPGSNASLELFEELRALSEEARAKGLLVIVWSYPRGNVSSAGETALDVVSYGAHMACLLGAHIVKVKIPSAHLEKENPQNLGDVSDLKARINYVKKAAFAGRRLVIFSGGSTKGDADLLSEAQAIRAGGGDGSIIGRNIFQRPEQDAKELVKKLVSLYKD